MHVELTDTNCRRIWVFADFGIRGPCNQYPMDIGGWLYIQLSSVQFSRSVMSNSLQSHEPQHARPACPSPTPRVDPNSCPLSRWCHPTISSSVVPFSSCPQSFPASGSFQMSQLFASVLLLVMIYTFDPYNKHVLSAYSALSLLRGFEIQYNQGINPVLREPVSGKRDGHKIQKVH